MVHARVVKRVLMWLYFFKVRGGVVVKLLNVRMVEAGTTTSFQVHREQGIYSCPLES